MGVLPCLLQVSASSHVCLMYLSPLPAHPVVLSSLFFYSISFITTGLLLFLLDQEQANMLMSLSWSWLWSRSWAQVCPTFCIFLTISNHFFVLLVSIVVTLLLSLVLLLPYSPILLSPLALHLMWAMCFHSLTLTTLSYGQYIYLSPTLMIAPHKFWH